MERFFSNGLHISEIPWHEGKPINKRSSKKTNRVNSDISTNRCITKCIWNWFYILSRFNIDGNIFFFFWNVRMVSLESAPLISNLDVSFLNWHNIFSFNLQHHFNMFHYVLYRPQLRLFRKRLFSTRTVMQKVWNFMFLCYNALLRYKASLQKNCENEDKYIK